MRTAILIATALLVSGCEQQYRYYCHDPANWEDKRCTAPLCEINKDCPKHILPKQECGPDVLTKGERK